MQGLWRTKRKRKGEEGALHVIAASPCLSFSFFQHSWDGDDSSLFLGLRVGCLISLLLLHNQSKSWTERKNKKFDLLSFQDLLLSLKKRKEKKSDQIWFLDLPIDFFEFLEKRIKRNKIFDNPRSDLCKGASIPVRLESPDQISLVWIFVEVRHLYDFKKILKTSIDYRIETSTNHEDIYGSSYHGEDLSMQR